MYTRDYSCPRASLWNEQGMVEPGGRIWQVVIHNGRQRVGGDRVTVMAGSCWVCWVSSPVHVHRWGSKYNSSCTPLLEALQSSQFVSHWALNSAPPCLPPQLEALASPLLSCPSQTARTFSACYFRLIVSPGSCPVQRRAVSRINRTTTIIVGTRTGSRAIARVHTATLPGLAGALPFLAFPTLYSQLPLPPAPQLIL